MHKVPSNIILEAISSKSDALKAAGVTVTAQPGEDVDLEMFEVRVHSAVAHGELEFTSGGNGYMELIHVASGRYILRKYYDDAPARAIKAAIISFLDAAIAVHPDRIPPELPLPAQYLDWVRRAARARELPISPWVASGSLSAPFFPEDDRSPPYVTSEFKHYVSDQIILLSIYEDGHATIEHQVNSKTPPSLIRRTPVANTKDFWRCTRRHMTWPKNVRAARECLSETLSGSAG